MNLLDAILKIFLGVCAAICMLAATTLCVVLMAVTLRSEGIL